MLAEYQSAVCNKGIEMKTITTVSIAVIGCLSVLGPLLAADNCKECRDFHRACLTAHSKAACKTDYDICTSTDGPIISLGIPVGFRAVNVA